MVIRFSFCLLNYSVGSYKKIFSSNNLFENLNKINGEFEGNELVQEVTKFIEKDKKRPICSPLSEK